MSLLLLTHDEITRTFEWKKMTKINENEINIHCKRLSSLCQNNIHSINLHPDSSLAIRVLNAALTKLINIFIDCYLAF